MAKDLVDLFNLTEQKIDDDLNHYRITICGNFGTGKSTLATELFNRNGNRAIVFGFEDRFKGIPNINVVRIHSWEEALGYKRQLSQGIKKGAELPFNTIIIDPVGIAGDMCTRYICETNGVEQLGDLAYGVGYNLLEQEFNSYIDGLRNMGFIVQFVAHGKLQHIVPPRDEEGYDIWTPDVPKKLIYKTEGEADFICYLDVLRQVDERTGRNEPVRRLYLQNYADYRLKVPVTGLPDYIDYKTPQEGAEKFIKAFKKAVKGENVESKATTKETAKNANTSDLEALRAKAIEIRDKMLNSGKGKREVATVLKETLGTAKISECEDEGKLKAFIESN